ncbi:MAG: Flp pilus assembly complex ATPase component TadA [Acidobacteria bacterium]|nr:Flp pilus assembly complex ATPase component TadA [Acidobacteriota bacterium]
MLTALSAYIPDTERIVVIEDTAELQIDKPNLVRFEARRAQADLPAVSISIHFVLHLERLHGRRMVNG